MSHALSPLISVFNQAFHTVHRNKSVFNKHFCNTFLQLLKILKETGIITSYNLEEYDD